MVKVQIIGQFLFTLKLNEGDFSVSKLMRLYGIVLNDIIELTIGEDSTHLPSLPQIASSYELLS